MARRVPELTPAIPLLGRSEFVPDVCGSSFQFCAVHMCTLKMEISTELERENKTHMHLPCFKWLSLLSQFVKSDTCASMVTSTALQSTTIVKKVNHMLCCSIYKSTQNVAGDIQNT